MILFNVDLPNGYVTVPYCGFAPSPLGPTWGFRFTS